MDGTTYFPSRPEMESALQAFAERTALSVRHGCRWESTRRFDDGRFELTTTDGLYTAGTLILAVGVAEPWRPDTPGIDFVAHYADTRAAETYADRRGSYGSRTRPELASGLRPGAPDQPRHEPGEAVSQHALAGRYPGAPPPAARGSRLRRRRRAIDASIEAIKSAPWRRIVVRRGRRAAPMAASRPMR
jgi:hypothetical protein